MSPKPAKEVSGNSLQKPSDKDATYDGHKGQGYQVHIAESCTESLVDQALSLITHAVVESAHIHDSGAVIPAIEKMAEMDIAPTRLLADAAYGGDNNNYCAAKDHGVELISPTLGTGKSDKIGLDAFVCGDGKQIEYCHSNALQSNTKVEIMMASLRCSPLAITLIV